MNETRVLCRIIVATAIVAVASLCHLSTLYDSAMARVRGQGSWCERTGPAPHGMALWSDDGGETWHE